MTLEENDIEKLIYDGQDFELPTGTWRIGFKQGEPGRVNVVLLDEDLDAILEQLEREPAVMLGSVQFDETLDTMIDELLFLNEFCAVGDEPGRGVFDDEIEQELLPIAIALEAAAARLRSRLKKR